MARQLYQLANVQSAFAARIREKVQGRQEEAQEQADDIPLLGWLIRPLTGLAFDIRENRNAGRGERGENHVLQTLLRWLPDTWCVFHNVVIDLLLVSSAGIFLVETVAVSTMTSAMYSPSSGANAGSSVASSSRVGGAS